jgi:hypothetical protein
MNRGNFFWSCCWLLLLWACNGNQAAFQSEYEALKKSSSGSALFSSLLLLDQKYPWQMALKVDIGRALLEAGELEQAAIYLKSGEALASRSKDQRLKALLYAALAEHAFRRGQHQETIELATKALANPPQEPAGALLTRARACQATRKTREALEDYTRGWSTDRSAMIPDDFRNYSALLIAAGKYAEALEVYAEYQILFTYEAGIGLTESLLYEKLARIEESIVAAFKELEYQRYRGGVPEALIQDNLAKLSRKLDDRQWNPEGKGKSLVAALRRYARGEWREAARGLEQAGPALDLRFGRYLLLSAKLETGQAAEADFREYGGLEPYLKRLPAYYYHLWRGMRHGSGGDLPAGVRPVLEKCILLAPNTPFALESRRALGRLIGLAAAEGEKLLLGPELEAIGRRMAAGESLDRLEPVLELLSTPDNEYQLLAVVLLKQLKSREQVRAYLIERARTSTGRLKERLSFVLSN